MGALGHGTPRSKSPVFVVGCPRSGTTLLYHMLLSAGNFAVYRAESQVFNILEPRFGDLSSPRNRRALLTAWYQSPLFEKTGLRPDVVDGLMMEECRNGGDFLRIYMEAMARQQSVERWADCTPEHLLYLKRIKQTIPDALIIHVLRDGRDVSLSLEKQGWIKPFKWHRDDGLAVAALYWDWIVRRGRALGAQLGADYLEVQYENLVQSPVAALDRISDFVGQHLDYAQIQKIGIGSVSRPNTSFAADLKEQEFQPVARWKSGMSEDQQAVVDTLVGETLQELGYPTKNETVPPTDRKSLQRMRSLYHSYFSTKFILKSKTALGRSLVTRDLSWA
jgi:LPS sulfotransferase NodH